MPGLTCAALGEACRIFLGHAYPQGEETIPGPRRSYLRIHSGQPLDPLLKSPICQALPTQNGRQGGWSFRLGSACYPNLKLQVVDCEGAGALVFCVDTHDGMLPRDPNHPDADRVAALQAANRQLKEKIEEAWEAAGLLTFNGLLRRQLAASAG